MQPVFAAVHVSFVLDTVDDGLPRDLSHQVLFHLMVPAVPAVVVMFLVETPSPDVSC